MSKRKLRLGPKIMSLDELIRQEFIFFNGRAYHNGWFRSWQIRMFQNCIGKGGCIHYAMPADKETRFSDEDVLRAEHRLGKPATIEGRVDVIEILNNFDRGRGDVDDVIDEYEDDPGY